MVKAKSVMLSMRSNNTRPIQKMTKQNVLEAKAFHHQCSFLLTNGLHKLECLLLLSLSSINVLSLFGSLCKVRIRLGVVNTVPRYSDTKVKGISPLDMLVKPSKGLLGRTRVSAPFVNHSFCNFYSSLACKVDIIIS